MRKSAVALVLVLLASLGAIAPTPRRRGRAKVVIIVGATHGATPRYREQADRAYAEAIKYTSNVVKVYSPNATWARVKAAVVGASVVIYFGHGNGWPSPYTYDPKYTTKNGFGLNKVEGAGDNNNVYYGEPYVSTLDLAPGAVVMLHHLCYAAGNSEPGQAEPSVRVARQRADNYAAGFLKAGAAAVIADGHCRTRGVPPGAVHDPAAARVDVGQPVERERQHRLVPVGPHARRHRLPGSGDPDLGVLSLDRRPLGGRARRRGTRSLAAVTVDAGVAFTAGTAYGATTSCLFSTHDQDHRPSASTSPGSSPVVPRWRASGSRSGSPPGSGPIRGVPSRTAPRGSRTRPAMPTSTCAARPHRGSPLGPTSRVMRRCGPLVTGAPRAVSLTGRSVRRRRLGANHTRLHQTHPYYPRAGPSADGPI